MRRIAKLDSLGLQHFPVMMKTERLAGLLFLPDGHNVPCKDLEVVAEVEQ
jgi:hypothetical protein